MKRAIGWALAAALALALVIYWTRPAPACGPFFSPTVFTETTHPDSPLGPYTRGRLGVLQPGYNRVYLYVAYRNLAGPGFDHSEALALWGIPPESAQLLDKAPTAGTPPPPTPPPKTVAASRAWIVARNQIAGTGHLDYFQEWNADSGIYREENGPGGRYEFYLNCPQQAFKASSDTLEDRSQKYGAGSPELAAWVKAQDTVFSNCQKGENIPAPLEADASPLARADRRYQIAAAYFYAGDFAKAVAGFREIAGDHASPWSPIANYLVARAYIRQATVGRNDNSPDPAALTNAETQLKQVLADPQLAEFRKAAADLLDYVEVRLHPERRAGELAKALMQKPAPADLAQKVHDYTFILDKLESERFAQAPGELQSSRRALYPKLAAERRNDELTDWILTFQLQDSASADHAYERWQQTKSRAWLVAAITKIQPGDPRAPELIAAARPVSPSSPAYASVTFHRFRLMRQGGERAAVLPELNRLLARDAGSLPPSALNLFLAMRLTYAQTLADFLHYAQRVPVDLEDNGYATFEHASAHPPEGSPWFDSDALTVLNELMTPALLAETARDHALPAHLRREVARGAWTRAFLLGEDRAALQLAPLLGELQPELRSSLAAFANAAPEERRFAGALTLLRFPGLRPYITSPERDMPTGEIDSLRENWWCRGGPAGMLWGRFGAEPPPAGGPQAAVPRWPVIEAPLDEIYPRLEVPPPPFLSRAELDEARRDWQRTLALAGAPVQLGTEVLAWVQKHPDDPQAAEALALVVRAGHYGCTDRDNWKLSKQAFEMLHGRYSASAWAKKTRYWYR